MKKQKIQPTKVDLGCGRCKKEGFFGIDQFKGPEVDLMTNIDEKLPIEDNCVEELYTSHVLEHVKDLSFVMSEIHRICKPDAKVIIRVPHFSSVSAFFEFHVRFFRYNSFQDFLQTEENMFVTEKPVKFHVVKRMIKFDKRYYVPWNYFFEFLMKDSKRLSLFYEETGLRNLFPAREIYFELKVIKNG
jgi:ubiquinone/menaquinone biosynthesis C-methylase UbiE